MYLCSKHKNQLLRHNRITDDEKHDHICEICGTADGKIHWLSKANKYVCNKHRSQYNRLGYFLNRTKRDKNIIQVCDNYAEILFEDKNNNTVSKAIIDKDDVDRCSKHKWYTTEQMGNTKYVKSIINGTCVSLHRFIMNAPDGTIVDHINRNGLDNRKRNLRFVTCSENCVNSKTTSSSGEKNIYKRKGRYVLQIKRNYKTVCYKSFNNLSDAVSYRDIFIEKYNKAHNRII